MDAPIVRLLTRTKFEDVEVVYIAPRAAIFWRIDVVHVLCDGRDDDTANTSSLQGRADAGSRVPCIDCEKEGELKENRKKNGVRSSDSICSITCVVRGRGHGYASKEVAGFGGGEGQ